MVVDTCTGGGDDGVRITGTRTRVCRVGGGGGGGRETGSVTITTNTTATATAAAAVTATTTTTGHDCDGAHPFSGGNNNDDGASSAEAMKSVKIVVDACYLFTGGVHSTVGR